MKRRDFLRAAAVALAAEGHRSLLSANDTPNGHEHGGPASRTFATPQDAIQSPPEKQLYVVGLHTGTEVNEPDFLATIDTDPASTSYGQITHRLPMTHIGDELHHYGWSACSSCHGDANKPRRYLVIPGLRSSRIYVVDTVDPARPSLHHVIEPDEIHRKTNLSAPHTVHCLDDGSVMISMLGDAKGNAPGGFLLLDEWFNVVGKWENDLSGMQFNYDFWYQPAHNVMVSSEWTAPKTAFPGFHLEDVQAGRYGRRLHFWDWTKKVIVKSFDLGESGMIPLEVRFHHDPQSTHGFVGAALGSSLWHWHQSNGDWQVEKVVQVEPVEQEGWPFPIPGLTTDILISMDDRFLYMANWFHGDVRQYNIEDPSNPKLTGQVWCGGQLGKPNDLGRENLVGGPQMLQLSLDGKRLYVTNSLFSSWDNQFYPDIAKAGSYLLQIDCDAENGAMAVNKDFFVDFGKEPLGPARAHEVRFPNGDCTSDIWV